MVLIGAWHWQATEHGLGTMLKETYLGVPDTSDVVLRAKNFKCDPVATQCWLALPNARKDRGQS